MGECSYGDPLPRPRDEGGGAGGHVRVVDRTSGHVTQKESLESLISFAFPSVHLISDQIQDQLKDRQDICPKKLCDQSFEDNNFAANFYQGQDLVQILQTLVSVISSMFHQHYCHHKDCQHYLQRDFIGDKCSEGWRGQGIKCGVGRSKQCDWTRLEIFTFTFSDFLYFFFHFSWSTLFVIRPAELFTFTFTC